jgi:hypothetical protein
MCSMLPAPQNLKAKAAYPFVARWRFNRGNLCGGRPLQMVVRGWQQFCIRNGWKTFVSDAVERGRSGFASPDIWPSSPQHLTRR